MVVIESYRFAQIAVMPQKQCVLFFFLSLIFNARITSHMLAQTKANLAYLHNLGVETKILIY